MRSVFLFIFGAVILLQSLEAKERILFLGDSLTAGYGLSEDAAYPQLIAKKLKSDGKEIEIINGGVSGDTTAGGLRRLPWMLKKSDPTILMIALGGNDMLRGLPPEKTEDNILKMIELAEEHHVSVWILGINAPANMGAQYVQKFDAIFRSIEKKKKIPILFNYIKPVAGRSTLNLADGIHPNQKGQELLAENILDFIQPLLKKERPKK